MTSLLFSSSSKRAGGVSSPHRHLSGYGDGDGDGDGEFAGIIPTVVLRLLPIRSMNDHLS